MSITFSVSNGEVNLSAHYGQEREVNLNDQEKLLVSVLFDILERESCDTSLLRITRKSDSYATICMQGKNYEYDIIRFKYTDRAKWISISMSHEDRLSQVNNPLFVTQKNKNQIMWKASLASMDDCYGLAPYIIHSYSYISTL